MFPFSNLPMGPILKTLLVKNPPPQLEIDGAQAYQVQELLKVESEIVYSTWSIGRDTTPRSGLGLIPMTS